MGVEGSTYVHQEGGMHILEMKHSKQCKNSKNDEISCKKNTYII